MLRTLHRVNSPQPFPVAGIKQDVGALVPEPVVGGVAVVQVAHLDTLHLAELDEAVPADNERGNRRHRGDHSKSPVGFLYEILQVHAVPRRQEGAHCEAESAHAELEIEQHERVTVSVKNGTDTVKWLVACFPVSLVSG